MTSLPTSSQAAHSTGAPGATDLISSLRQQLKLAQDRNQAAWNQGLPPARPLRAHAQAIDDILRSLWASAGFAQASLVAVGGYGRGELFPFSDVDLLILLPDDYQEAVIKAPAEALVGQLWDIGLDAGHSIRSVAECMQQAREDLTIATSLLEARWIAGPKARVDALRQAWARHINVKDFAQGKLLEMQQRHARHQDTPSSLEPNCKESPGGLRDLQVLRWVTTAFGLGHRWQDLARNDLITAEEARQLQRDERALQTIRGHLHLVAGRREDRLVFDLQHALAQKLHCEPKAGRRASEVLMQRYYRASTSVLQISSMLLANLEPRLFPSPSFSQPREARVIDADFQEAYGLLDLRSERLFEENPAALLRAFLVLAQNPELRGMSARLLRSIWNHRKMIDSRYRKAPQHKALLLAILQQPRGIVHGLRLMNNLGVLGQMLPVFRRIVGQMQHDLFHVYTVDQHILQVVRNLRRFTMDEHAHEFPLCSRLMAEFEWPWVLYVAALFHDIAKGRGGDHSTLGKTEVRRFARDYGLAPEIARLVEFLVAHHLTMSQVAQKQDLSDPDVIAAFAKIVATPKRLTALYLLTVADIRGTSPKVWNNWKGRLLEELYHRTLTTLTHQPPRGTRRRGGPSVPNEQPQDAFHSKTAEAERILLLHSRDPEMAREFWRSLELQYFLRHEASEIAWHARAIAHRRSETSPIVIARLSPDEDGLQVVVYQPDAPELFARICSYFDSQNMGIMDAKIHTTIDGYAMDTFMVDHRQFPGHHREMIAIVEAGLADVLQARLPLPAPVKGRVSRQSKHFPIPPTVDLRPDAKGQYHVLTVTAADRAGLLYAIAKTLANHQVTLQTARVMTLGERAEDVFLIQGESLNENRQQISLEADLLKALEA